MNIHKNARLTPLRREEMAVGVTSGRLSRAQAARLYGVSPKIVSRWVERIVGLRRQRMSGKHIAMEAGVSPATVSWVLKHAGLSRMKDLALIKLVVRYKRVVHRITGTRTAQCKPCCLGWEFVHASIYDASRSAFTSIFPDEKAIGAVAFLMAVFA